MEKQCKKCGKKLDNDFSDYCLDCLKFSYSKLVKEKQEQKEDSVLNSCNKEEATLIVIANIVLTIGIIASIVFTNSNKEILLGTVSRRNGSFRRTHFQSFQGESNVVFRSEKNSYRAIINFT